jgi:hypothetical protein
MFSSQEIYVDANLLMPSGKAEAPEVILVSEPGQTVAQLPASKAEPVTRATW